MKPYYERNGITIYHGDCREVVPTLNSCFAGFFDLMLTDPPYGIGRDGQKRTTGGHGGRKGYDFLGWDGERPDAETFALLTSRARVSIIWGGNYFADILPARSKWLVWDKGQRINQSDGELAWTSMDGALRVFTLNRVAIMQDGAVHPTQKPEALMRWCIQQSDSYTATVLDPFCGSGSTLRAAKDMGLAAVGIEREERYCEIAARRLSQEVLFGVGP
jgi:site-specific DNA-methyltransferase (adenine-specific)